MTERPSEIDRTVQVSAIYDALGRFVVEFSRMVNAMEFSLYFSVGGNQQLFGAVTAELTAYPLAQAWRSIMAKTADLKEEDRKVLSGIHAEIVYLITLRNDWSHGTWFVGYGDVSTTDWSSAALHRLKNSANGLAAPKDLETLPTAEYIKAVASHTAFMVGAIFDFGANVQLLRDLRTVKRPSDRIRIGKLSGRRRFQMSSDGTDWRSSEMPVRPAASPPSSS